MAQKINKENLNKVMANRTAILDLAKGMTMEQMKEFDALLDTMVFGKPMGLMGERMQNATAPAQQIEDIDDQICEVANA